MMSSVSSKLFKKYLKIVNSQIEKYDFMQIIKKLFELKRNDELLELISLLSDDYDTTFKFKLSS